MTVQKVLDSFIRSGRLSAPRRKMVQNVYYEMAWDSRLKNEFDMWLKTRSREVLIPGTHMLTTRNQFMVEVWEREPTSFKEQVTAQLDAEYEHEMNEWKKKRDSYNSIGGDKCVFYLHFRTLPSQHHLDSKMPSTCCRSFYLHY